MNALYSLLATTVGDFSSNTAYVIWRICSYASLAGVFVCSILAIIVCFIQPSSSNGVDALSGASTDTFFGKNKGKSIESKMKRMTIWATVIMAVLSIVFYVLRYWA